MKNKYTALLLGWLVPGLGHFYAGKRKKALIFLITITASALLGLILGRFRNCYFQPDHYQFYAEVGNGLFTLVASAVMRILGARVIESTAAGGDLAGIIPIADLYLMVAGLLNYIVAANAFDTVAAEIRGEK